MSSAFFWTLLLLSGVLVGTGLVYRRWQHDVGLMMAFFGLVIGLFTLGFAAGQYV